MAVHAIRRFAAISRHSALLPNYLESGRLNRISMLLAALRGDYSVRAPHPHCTKPSGLSPLVLAAGFEDVAPRMREVVDDWGCRDFSELVPVKQLKEIDRRFKGCGSVEHKAGLQHAPDGACDTDCEVLARHDGLVDSVN